MQASDNAYAAPQTIDLRAVSEPPCERPALRFKVEYVWHGIARGFTAGLLAALSMILLYLVRMLSGYQAEALNLLLIAAVFISLTMLLGFVWGLAYACLAMLAPEAMSELKQMRRQSGTGRGDS